MKFKYYFVAHKDDPHTYLTIVENKKQAGEFINNLIFLNHLQDFKSWCYYNQKAEDIDSWREFLDKRVPEEDKTGYIIGSRDFNKSQIAAILRMFAGCSPKGCFYERPEEYEYFGSKLLAKRKLVDKVQELTEQELKKLDEQLDNLKDNEFSEVSDTDSDEVQ